jgi:phosphate transport system substrate-binding protein
MKRVVGIALAVIVCAVGTASSQEFAAMPEYVPRTQISGVVRVSGDYHQRAMLKDWEDAFQRYQPGITFQNNLTSTVHGIPALVFDVADLGLLGREIAPLENLSFRRMFKYDPMEIVTATGSFDTPYQAFALGVFVNKQNPLTKLTLQQAASVFGCGPGGHVTKWGQLGLTGEWADKPIHIFGYPSDNNIAAFFALKVFETGGGGGPTLPNGPKWACDIKEYANTYDANDKPIVSSDAFMMRDLGKDRYAIAYSGIAEQTPEVKPLALAVRAGAPYIPFTLANVADRSYPLTRSMYVYLNAAPGHPAKPAVAEFLRFVLSRQGQESVAKQKIFLPLTTAAAQEGLRKLQ